jgi:hypothetical protein
VAEPHPVCNNFLPYLDGQVTSDAISFEMIFFTDDEAQKEA